MKRKNRAVGKNAASEDTKAGRRQELKRLSDKAVLITALAVLYAILLLFLQNMGLSTTTVSGAMTFLQILFWGSIVGAIFFAVWAAYRERRGLMLYSGVFLFVLWTVTIILHAGNWHPKFALVYASLFVAVVLFHVGVRLMISGKYQKARLPFIIVCAAVFALFSLCAVGLRLGYVGQLVNMVI